MDLSSVVSPYFDAHVYDALEEIGGLFNLRMSRVHQRLTLFSSIDDIDRRIEKKLDYLHMQIDAVKEYSFELYDQLDSSDIGDTSESFAIAIILYTSDDQRWIENITNRFLLNQECRHGLAFGLAWLPWNSTRFLIQTFFLSDDPLHQWLAARVCRLKNQYPRTLVRKNLHANLTFDNAELAEQLIHMVGENKDAALVPILLEGITFEESHIQSAAHRSLLLLDNRKNLDAAITCSLEGNELFQQLSTLVISRLPFVEAKNYLSRAFNKSELAIDLKIEAIANFGEPSTIAWLLKTYSQPSLFPWIGLAFFQITGLDISDYTLGDSTIDEEVDEVSELNFYDRDHSLPIPDTKKLLDLWLNIHRGFQIGRRYFLGTTLNADGSIPNQERYFSLNLYRQKTALSEAIFHSSSSLKNSYYFK